MGNEIKVVIIGSLKDSDTITEAADYFKSLGNSVIEPLQNNLDESGLTGIQSRYLTYLKEADLVVVVPKAHKYSDSPCGAKIDFLYGESTSYELAISKVLLNKKVLFWVN